MKTLCYNCNQQKLVLNVAHPKCQICGSQAVEFINQPQRQNQRRERHRQTQYDNRHYDREINRKISPFEMFQQMKMPFSMRVDNKLDSMMKQMKHIMRSGRTNQINEMNNFMLIPQNNHWQQYSQSGPTFYQQRIITNPNGTFIYSTNSNNNGYTQFDNILFNPNATLMQQIQIKQSAQQQKPKISDFVSIDSLAQQCAICHLNENKGVSLPCGHQFHNECLKPWFQVKDNCPCCRYKLNNR